jgi:hypothetical protein
MDANLNSEAVSAATNHFYGLVGGCENELYDRLCACEDDGEIDMLLATITRVEHVDSCARALELKVMFDGSVVPVMARLAETSSRCMAEGGAGGENVPWGELANLFDAAIAATCAPSGTEVSRGAFEEASWAVERRLAECRCAEERERAMEAVRRRGVEMAELHPAELEREAHRDPVRE